MPFNQSLRTNPLVTKEDFVQALVDLVTPMYRLMAAEETPGRAHIGTSGAVYDARRADIEGFLRTLWGVGPLCHTEALAHTHQALYTPATAGIIAGCDPKSPSYWGQLHDYDQLFVEMGALATFLILTQPFFFDRLPARDQENIHAWLDQINHHQIPQNNWLFFRVLVNTFFAHADLGAPAPQLEQDLATLDTYYLEAGWYFDGYPDQIDYYIPFGMQYYGLVYSKLAFDPKAPHVALFKDRASAFAERFKDWFVKDGTALPFGRSQTYRFAQSAFWAASAFAEVPLEGVSLGETKYLLQQNMHRWFNRDIFTADDRLSIGYGYANLNYAEGYNAPGSPYWGLKNFIVLALPDDAEFWTVPATEPTFSKQAVNPYARMLLVHSADGNELQAFTAGQHSHEHAHGEDKYEKYVYSTTFGFSIKKGSVLPKQGAYDNTLALSEGPTDFKTAFGYQAYAIHDDYVYAKWQPWADVTVETYLLPLYPWHLRLHVVHTNRLLHYLEGSFSAPSGGQALEGALGAFYQSAVGTVGIASLTPGGTATLMPPEPNTNIYYPQTILPLVSGQWAPGHHQSVVACLGAAHQALPVETLPHFSHTGNVVTLAWQDQTRTVTLVEANKGENAL